MSCGCENRRMGMEEGRIRRLAKAWAVSEGQTVALYVNADGTFGFTPDLGENRNITEYITPY